MAKKISERRLKEVVGRVLHDGSYLEVESYNLKVPIEELKLALRRMYPGGCKNSQYKAVLTTSSRNASHVPKDELEKLRILPKPSRTAKAPAPASAHEPASAQTPQPEPATAQTPQSEPDPMELFLLAKEKLKQELEACDARCESAESVLQIRTDALTAAHATFQKAQAAFEKAKNDKAEAEAAVKQAKTAVWATLDAIQQVESEIQDLNTRTVYLVDPWFSGEFPSYGTFLSTVEMDGVCREIVPADYLPEATVEGILLFDLVPDFKKARAFCGLVSKFELDEKPYTLLVTDERVKELLKMYI